MGRVRYETDPENVARVRLAISEASKDLILLQETLSYLRESLHEVLLLLLPWMLRVRTWKMPQLLELTESKTM